MYEAYRVMRNVTAEKKLYAKKALALGVGMVIAGGMSSNAMAGDPTLFVNDGTDGGCGAFNESVGEQVHVDTCAVKSLAELKTAGVAAGTMVINGNGTFINGKLSMLAGTAATDAVNVGQLLPLVDALGGNARIDPSTGTVTGPIYTLASGTQTSVEGALYTVDGMATETKTTLNQLRNQLNSGGAGMVLQDSADQPITVASGLGGDTVDFTGKKDGVSLSRKLTGVSDGAVTSTSKDAVTGAQLYNTNKKVSTNTDNIAALQDQVSTGSVGLVKQDATTHAITLAAATGGTHIDVAGTEGTRVLSGVANGTADSDAVTIAQLKAAGLVNPDGKPMLALVYDDLAMGGATLGGTRGTVLHNLAKGSIAKGSMEAVNGGQLFDFQQDVQQRMSALNGQVDALNTQVSHIQKGIDDGSMGGSGGGSGSGTGSAVMGKGAQASGSGSMAMGVDANASGANGTASGHGAQATGANSTASGAHAVASGTGSTALGTDSRATASNAVALGAGSVADRDNTVSVGAAGSERQLTHVAAGTQRTDAANWGQVQDALHGMQDWTNRRFEHIGRRIDQMGAMSQANAQMAMNAGGVQPGGRGRIVAGVGLQGSRSALSVGYANAISERVRFSFGGSTSSSDASVGAGIGIDL